MSSVKSTPRNSPKRKKVQRPSLQRLGIYRLSPFIIIMGPCLLFLWFYFHNDVLMHSLSKSVNTVMVHLGFTLEDVIVEGRMRTDKKQILKTLQLSRGMPLLSISPFDAKKKLENISWVKAARVERRLPDTLFIRISEKEPVAIWQNQNKIYLVDHDGELIEIKETSKYKELLLVTGHQAPRHVGKLISLLDKFPEIKTRVTAATHLRSSRWDIRLDKIEVRLPEKDAEGALEYLLSLQNHHRFMEREIMTIDMRLPGQLILRLTPEAIQKKNHLGKDA